MKKIKITVMRMARYDDLMAIYENPIEHACDLHLGQVFYVEMFRSQKDCAIAHGRRFFLL